MDDASPAPSTTHPHRPTRPLALAATTATAWLGAVATEAGWVFFGLVDRASRRLGRDPSPSRS